MDFVKQASQSASYTCRKCGKVFESEKIEGFPICRKCGDVDA